MYWPARLVIQCQVDGHTTHICKGHTSACCYMATRLVCTCQAGAWCLSQLRSFLVPAWHITTYVNVHQLEMCINWLKAASPACRWALDERTNLCLWCRAGRCAGGTSYRPFSFPCHVYEDVHALNNLFYTDLFYTDLFYTKQACSSHPCTPTLCPVLPNIPWPSSLSLPLSLFD